MSAYSILLFAGFSTGEGEDSKNKAGPDLK